MAGVDDRDARAQAGQLVGQGQADQPGSDHGDVAVLPVHDPESTRPLHPPASGAAL